MMPWEQRLSSSDSDCLVHSNIETGKFVYAAVRKYQWSLGIDNWILFGQEVGLVKEPLQAHAFDSPVLLVRDIWETR